MTDKNRRRLEQMEAAIVDEKVQIQITIEFIAAGGEVARTIDTAVELPSRGRRKS